MERGVRSEFWRGGFIHDVECEHVTSDGVGPSVAGSHCRSSHDSCRVLAGVLKKIDGLCRGYEAGEPVSRTVTADVLGFDHELDEHDLGVATTLSV